MRLAGGAENRKLAGNETLLGQAKKGGQEFAASQVAGGAEDDDTHTAAPSARCACPRAAGLSLGRRLVEERIFVVS